MFRTAARILFISCFVSFSILSASACGPASYPFDKIESSIKEICAKEYKIQDVQVQIAGKTIGVFLPLKKLFTRDVRQLVVTGQIENLESLFEPEPEAMSQLEDVLFAISRVLLSTNRRIDFYVLKAVDVEGTGLELVLTGFIDDIRRVRLWDISRTDYRKRVIHELKLNRAILWERPVAAFIDSLKTKEGDPRAPLSRFFSKPFSPQSVLPFFYEFVQSMEVKEGVDISVQSIRSHAYGKLNGLVYLNIREDYRLKPGEAPAAVSYPSGSELEFIFVVEPAQTEFKIAQVISFQYVDETGALKRTEFPPELRVYENIEAWDKRFDVAEVFLGDFLAEQLNRRLQALLTMDERVRLTIKHARIHFTYYDAAREPGLIERPPYFELYFNFLTKSMAHAPAARDQVLEDEDVQYVFGVVMREFVDVIRSYRFEDFEGIDLVWEPAGGAENLTIPDDSLELFRKHKIGISELLLGLQGTE